MPAYGAHNNKSSATRAEVDAEKAKAEAATKALEDANALIQSSKKDAEEARGLVEEVKAQMKDLKARLETAEAAAKTARSESARDVQPEVAGDTGDTSIGQPTEPAVLKVATSTSGNPDAERPSLLKDKNSEPSSYLCGSIFDMDGTSSVKRLWPNGQVLTYRFVNGHHNQRAKVNQVIPEWSRYANITFKLVDKEAAPSESIIAISFENTWGCWGYIGTDARTATDSPFTMGLGAVSDLPDTTHGDRAVILHQFGHALGLVHEHMCPSETDAVALKQDLIFKYYSSRYDGTSIGRRFDVYANGSVTNHAVPDLSSVMVYSMSGEYNEGNLTIEPNAALSPLDKAFMVINYPRPCAHYQASEWTLRHALLIANVDDDTSRAITQEHDLTKRRALFAAYLSTARQQHAAPLVDPAPKIVLDLTLPAVQDALRAFFNDIDGHPGAEEIRADHELMGELGAVLDRLASYHAVREVVQGALPPPPPAALVSPGTLEVNEDFTNRLVEMVVTLHAAVNPQVPVSTGGLDDAGVRQVDAVTALCKELARHAAFRRAMKQAIGKDALSFEPGASPSKSRPASTTPGLAATNPDDEGKTPDVSAIIAQLSMRPAVLQAVRQALVG